MRHAGVPLECSNGGFGDLGVLTLMAHGETHIQLVGHGIHATHSLERFLGQLTLRVASNAPRQRHDPVRAGGHRDPRRVDLWIPGELVERISLKFFGGSHHPLLVHRASSSGVRPRRLSRAYIPSGAKRRDPYRRIGRAGCRRTRAKSGGALHAVQVAPKRRGALSHIADSDAGRSPRTAGRFRRAERVVARAPCTFTLPAVGVREWYI